MNVNDYVKYRLRVPREPKMILHAFNPLPDDVPQWFRFDWGATEGDRTFDGYDHMPHIEEAIVLDWLPNNKNKS